MPVTAVRFGVGTFKLGTAPGTEFSCQVQNMALVPAKDTGDTIRTLCGDSVPGGISYTYSLTGTVLQDGKAVNGLQRYCWTNKGAVVAFEFTPSTADGTKWAGTCVVDPLSAGTPDGELGDVMTSDVEFSVVGEPVPTWGT